MEELLVKAARAGIRFEADGEELRVIAPSGTLTDELRRDLRLYKGEILNLIRSERDIAKPLPALEIDAVNRFEPFPLTDLQHAYWLGRDSSMEMGGVATHLYVELDCRDINVAQLNAALCRLIERHDMLRAVIDRDGMQRILPTVPNYKIAFNDRSTAAPAEIEQAIMEMRGALSHQVLEADRWPLFDIRVTLLPNSCLRLHVSLDLLILDAWSIFLFFREWHQLYRHPEKIYPELGISFRDYVLAERRLQDSPAYRRAQSYWMNRIETLPGPPDLPLRSDATARAQPRFSRREARLEKTRWLKLRAKARAEGLTPSGLLLAAYSEVLARWSTAPHFTLNVTVSNRLQMHKDVNNILGDFTSLIMQEVDRRDREWTFVEFARRLQKQFATDLEHNEISGVGILREWAKRRGSSLQAAMPVVFSSGLIWSGDDEVGDLEQFGNKVHSISQTSQVWLDHHVMELKGDLVFIWDAADAVFEDGVLDAMFSAYCDLIERLAEDPSLWTSCNVVPLPEDMENRRVQANHTAQPHVDRPLQAGFVTHALKHPQAIAILTPERTMSYGALLAESTAVADWLLQHGVRAGHPVAVVTHKGWEQIVAVYGALLAGAAYMPIDADLPVKRQQELLRIGEVTQILTQPNTLSDVISGAGASVHEIRIGAQSTFGPAHARSLDVDLDELAYVIFTSGTTGAPKGVMIDHRAAINTIAHINRLFGVGPDDRVLAVSSLSFDLSVYDIFGLLDAGGALVIPDYRKGHDAVHWRDLMAQHSVTLWNSAPQLMRMLMDSHGSDENTASSLRTVLLSGDFIPLDLPGRIRNRHTQAQIISLGGATEASIWSIYNPVSAVEPGWTSIPYGRPLPNQTIWVYDQAFRACPDYVQGRIFIGGTGLAQGYWRDAEKTAVRFIAHPETGERLYDTGDLGRYAPDGNVLILGRDDGQIKIRGHRVELGEIEAVLRQHPDIKQSVVLATAASSEARQLVAYIESAAGEVATSVHSAEPPQADLAVAHAQQLHPQAVKDYLAERLPDYMVPRHIVQLDRMPISANGKIDYRALPAISADAAEAQRECVLPRNAAEKNIFDAWSRLIAGCEIGVTDNFFELGGDSILATQLVRELNTALPSFKLEMHELFENLTIESLAALFESRTASDQDSTISGIKGPSPTQAAPTFDSEIIYADIRAVVAGFSTLDFGPRHTRVTHQSGHQASASYPQAVLLTGATGWLGAHVLSELLTLTQAQVYCLTRAHGKAEDHQRLRLIDTMRGYGIEILPSWTERVTPVCGDLSEPQLGLDATSWRSLSETVDSIYHLGASVGVLADYSTHSKVNVRPLASIVQLAAEHHRKPVFFSSPMAVCRRYRDGRLEVLSDERAHADPDGLLTGYSQSKWAAEHVLLAAAEQGLPIKIYRCSHALPSARNGLAKSNDTYGSILKVAFETGVIPEWMDSALYGVPVDILGRLMVENSLLSDEYRGIVHIENRHPLSLTSIIEIGLQTKNNSQAHIPRVLLEDWKNQCIHTAARLPGESASLARTLFTKRATGTAVENMFSTHTINTGYFDSLGKTSSLSRLTPAEYWRTVCSHPSW